MRSCLQGEKSIRLTVVVLLHAATPLQLVLPPLDVVVVVAEVVVVVEVVGGVVVEVVVVVLVVDVLVVVEVVVTVPPVRAFLRAVSMRPLAGKI